MHIFLMENNRTPLCVIRMTRSRTRRAPVLLRVWSSRSFSPLLVGIQNGTAALEDVPDFLENGACCLMHIARQSHALIFTQRVGALLPKIGSNQDVL